MKTLEMGFGIGIDLKKVFDYTLRKIMWNRRACKKILVFLWYRWYTLYYCEEQRNADCVLKLACDSTCRARCEVHRYGNLTPKTIQARRIFKNPHHNQLSLSNWNEPKRPKRQLENWIILILVLIDS